MKNEKKLDVLLSRARSAYEKLGAEVCFQKKETADADEVIQLEEQLKCGIPEELRAFFLSFSSDLLFSAVVPENFTLPEPLKEIFCAYIHLSMEEVLEAETSRRDWIQECFSDPEDEYDKIWYGKLGIMTVGNGDVIALDLEGGENSEKSGLPVVYLSHDDGEGHGCRLGENLEDYLEKLLMVGGCGNEDWQMMPFITDRQKGIDPFCANGELYRKEIGLDISLNDSVLLINDMAGYGKVALSAMIPIMSHMGFQLYNLPTALVSNTLDYGKFDILETTEYMKNTLNVWAELGFSFDAITTGFIVSEEQVRLIAAYCRRQKEKGSTVFVDPIMGDDGRLYNGVSEETIVYMRKLCAVADVIMPNYTEATFLADLFQTKSVLRPDEAEILTDALRNLGAGSVVITSMNLMGSHYVFGYDDKKEEYFQIPFDYIPVRFPGTGDIFSAVLVGNLLKGAELQTSVKKAMDTVRGLILRNRENADKYKGIPIEIYLEELKE